MKNITSIIHIDDKIYFINKKTHIGIVDNTKIYDDYISDQHFEEAYLLNNKYILASNIIDDLKNISLLNKDNDLLVNINIENIIDFFIN